MPLVWVVGLLIFAIKTKSVKKRKKLLILSLIVSLFFSNGFLSNEAYKLWEYKVTKFKDTPKSTYGIILSGFTGMQSDNDDRTYFNKGVDRMFHTIQLYKLGKIDTMVVTGGSVSVLETGKKTKSEAQRIADALIYCGIPKEKIILENKARNTYENALYTSKIIKNKKSILITSAFHMNRAKACFEHQGVSVFAFAVDFYSHERKFTPNFLFIPSEVALADWARLIHEIIGYVVYDIMGYY